MILCGAVCALAALLAGRPAAAACPEDRLSQTIHDEAKLHEDLLCGYHSSVRPVANYNSTVNVKIRLIVKYITFDALEQTLTVHSLAAMSWKDEFLTWNPTNYGGINEIQVESHEIWTPRLTLFNSDLAAFPTDEFYTTCLADSAGGVVCAPPVAHAALCAPALRRWPYGATECTLYIGSSHHGGEEKVNLTLYKDAVILDDYQNGPGWKLLKVEHERNSYPMLKFRFIMQREAAGPAATVVVPSIVVVILTMISLLLDVRDNIRLFLACFSLFGHYMLLNEIGYDIPQHGADTPIILLFIRDSMIMTLTAVVWTLVLMELRTGPQPTAAWLVAAARRATRGPLRRAVFTVFHPSDTDKKSITEDGPSAQAEGALPTTSEWIQFCNLLNSFVFIVYVFVYFVMICVYIPY